jgi:hypothetical protein
MEFMIWVDIHFLIFVIKFLRNKMVSRILGFVIFRCAAKSYKGISEEKNDIKFLSGLIWQNKKSNQLCHFYKMMPLMYFML